MQSVSLTTSTTTNDSTSSSFGGHCYILSHTPTFNCKYPQTHEMEDAVRFILPTAVTTYNRVEVVGGWISAEAVGNEKGG